MDSMFYVTMNALSIVSTGCCDFSLHRKVVALQTQGSTGGTCNPQPLVTNVENNVWHFPLLSEGQFVRQVHAKRRAAFIFMHGSFLFLCHSCFGNIKMSLITKKEETNSISLLSAVCFT